MAKWHPIGTPHQWPKDIPDEYIVLQGRDEFSVEYGLHMSAITPYLNSLALRIEELERKLADKA